MRLRANEVCPIHRSVSCCGRDRIAKPRLIRLGVQRGMLALPSFDDSLLTDH